MHYTSAAAVIESPIVWPFRCRCSDNKSQSNDNLSTMVSTLEHKPAINTFFTGRPTTGRGTRPCGCTAGNKKGARSLVRRVRTNEGTAPAGGGGGGGGMRMSSAHLLTSIVHSSSSGRRRGARTKRKKRQRMQLVALGSMVKSGFGAASECRAQRSIALIASPNLHVRNSS